MADRLAALGFASYEDYLRSDHWRRLVRRYRRRRCEQCGGRPTELHHRTYANLGRESAADLISLCITCHDRAHGRWSG